MSTHALVIGASPAGLQAALDLGDAGISVQLIESSPFFNNHDGTLPPQKMRQRQLEAFKHPNIHVRTNTRLESIKEEKHQLQVALVQHPRYIDLTKCTACGACIDACPVTLPGSRRKAIYIDGQPGCAAIEKLGQAPCAHTCPAGIHVQGYVALIAQERYHEAIELIHEAMPFPSVCGRVCNHYCEAECTRGKVDEPVNIMALKRFVADWEYLNERGSESLRSKGIDKAVRTGKRVAVIGSGPAGLTAARDMNRKGHQVTVFDSLPVAGGMMRVGIPAHRLPDELLDWEIQRILDEGVDLQLNTRINDIPGLLRDGFDAVLIASGAHVAKKLPIPNADHPDNWLSLDLLRRASLGESTELCGKRIAVLGGGNVALDTARTALRLGASEVRMICLEPRGEMPGFEWEIVVAEEEGIQLLPGRTFKEVVLKNDRIIAVQCTEVVFRGFKQGRPDFDEVPDSDHMVPADLVFWAIGQEADLSFLPMDGSIREREKTGIHSDENLMTTLTGVFVAGDVHRGVTFFVVDAIGEGHKVAVSIDRYLRGETGFVAQARNEKIKLRKSEINSRLRQSAQLERVQIASIPVEEREMNFREVDLTLSEEEAISEARRCLACGPCSECQACVQVCKAGAIAHDQQATHITLDVVGIIYAANKKNSVITSLGDHRKVISVKPHEALSASAAAAQLLAGATKRFWPQSNSVISAPRTNDPARIGAFICTCGGQISEIIDTERVCGLLAGLPDVVHSQVLPFSCSTEAAQIIQEQIGRHTLDKVVLAACSCCTEDQVCFSCTFQRMRTRQNLGVLINGGRELPGLAPAWFTFVNIREQCAWVHAGNSNEATAKAFALTSTAVSRSRAEAHLSAHLNPVKRSALVMGTGKAASVSRRLLKSQGILIQTARGFPERVDRVGGRYLAARGAQEWTGESMILSPRDAGEAERLLAAFGNAGLRPRIQDEFGGVNTHRPGVFYCDPVLEPGLAGSAAAARVLAWLGRKSWQEPIPVSVNNARCRSCGTCVEICEFGAPEILGEGGNRSAWIDPIVCLGCGVCAAHCPTGAISLSNSNVPVLANAIPTLLEFGKQVDEAA